jgi:D-alanine transfer protein
VGQRGVLLRVAVPAGGSGPHLLPAGGAVALLVALLLVGVAYARGVEQQAIHALAPLQFEQKERGSVLLREALRQPDLLPLYGSSELDHGDWANPGRLFAAYLTGFTTFRVGGGGGTPLTYLQALVAAGSELRGRQVALSLTPGPALMYGPGDDVRYYRGNFSRLQAYGLAFSELSLETKQAAARRLLDYPGTLETDPLLAFALTQLADGSWRGRALYAATFPLGWLRTRVLALQDHWETLRAIADQHDVQPTTPRRSAALDWQALLHRAKVEQSARVPRRTGRARLAGAGEGSSDTTTLTRPKDVAFVDKLERGRYWSDLDLLLRGLTELGARPVVLSAPLYGPYYDHTGVSAAARARYYRSVEAIAGRYGVPVYDFADHDEDRLFLEDLRGHPTPVGWIYYDRALDAFWHAGATVRADPPRGT